MQLLTLLVLAGAAAPAGCLEVASGTDCPLDAILDADSAGEATTEGLGLLQYAQAASRRSASQLLKKAEASWNWDGNTQMRLEASAAGWNPRLLVPQFVGLPATRRAQHVLLLMPVTDDLEVMNTVVRNIEHLRTQVDATELFLVHIHNSSRQAWEAELGADWYRKRVTFSATSSFHENKAALLRSVVDDKVVNISRYRWIWPLEPGADISRLPLSRLLGLAERSSAAIVSLPKADLYEAPDAADTSCPIQHVTEVTLGSPLVRPVALSSILSSCPDCAVSHPDVGRTWCDFVGRSLGAQFVHICAAVSLRPTQDAEACRKSGGVPVPSVFGVIFSKRSNFQRRAAIRPMWTEAARTNPNLHAKFALCRGADDLLDEQLLEEQAAHGDLLLLECPEGYAYGALTKRTVAALHAFKKSGKSFFYKVDDDTFVAWSRFAHALEQLSPWAYAGRLSVIPWINRDPLSVAFDVVPLALYPQGMFGGTGYVLGHELVEALLPTIDPEHMSYLEDRAVAIWVHQLNETGNPVEYVPWQMGNPWSRPCLSSFESRTWGDYPYLSHHGLHEATIACLALADQADDPSLNITGCYEPSILGNPWPFEGIFGGLPAELAALGAAGPAGRPALCGELPESA